MLRLVWNVDPVLLHVGPLQLRWYGLLFAVGILAAYRVGEWSFEQAGGSREEASRRLPTSRQPMSTPVSWVSRR